MQEPFFNIYLEKIASMLEGPCTEETSKSDGSIPIQYKDRPYHEKFFTRMRLRGT
jgi:hypothetical protein